MQNIPCALKTLAESKSSLFSNTKYWYRLALICQLVCYFSLQNNANKKSNTTNSQNRYIFLHFILNEWMMNLYSALLCIVVHPKRFTIMWGVSPQPPPVCSIHLDDATAATGQRRQYTHHTPATGGEEREIEPIKWMGIIVRPWLTRASRGNLARTPGLHPFSLRWVSWDF